MDICEGDYGDAGRVLRLKFVALMLSALLEVCDKGWFLADVGFIEQTGARSRGKCKSETDLLLGPTEGRNNP